MTLADILKPSITVICHAETKGLQLGATVGTALAVPGVLLRPQMFNPTDDAPLVAIANLAGIGAVTCATAVTLACAYKMSKLTKEGIQERCERICANEEQKKIDRIGCAGTAVGVALVAARVKGISNLEGKCVWGVLFRRQTAWELFAFGMMGAAVGVGGYCAGKFVCEKIGSRQGNNGVGDVNEVDEGDAENVGKQVVDAAVEDATI